MAASIKLEIDKESYEEVKNKLLELRVIAEEVGSEINRAAQLRLHLTAFGVGMLAFCAGFGVCWLAFVR